MDEASNQDLERQIQTYLGIGASVLPADAGVRVVLPPGVEVSVGLSGEIEALVHASGLQLVAIDEVPDDD